MKPFLLHVAQIGVFVFCFLIFVRNLDESLVKRRIKHELMPKIVTAFIFLAIFGAVFAEFFVVWMLLILILGQILIKTVQNYRKQRIETAVLLFVQHLILNISAGNSFQIAYFNSVSKLSVALQAPFKSIWDIQKLTSRQFPGAKTYELSKIVRQCRKNSSSCLGLLREFRKNLQFEESCDNKINGALSQIRTQLGFICLFFVSALYVLIKTRLIQQYIQWVSVSILLFTIGSYLVWYLPKGFKWHS